MESNVNVACFLAYFLLIEFLILFSMGRFSWHRRYVPMWTLDNNVMREIRLPRRSLRGRIPMRLRFDDVIIRKNFRDHVRHIWGNVGAWSLILLLPYSNNPCAIFRQ